MNRGSQTPAEQPFFFDVGNDRLFAMLHRPASGTPRRGLVLCQALAEENLWAHRVFVSLARALAQHGMAALRFDFRGEGDSDLEFEQAGIATRVDDAVRAAEVLLESLPGLPGVTFLGHRLGGAIAAAAAGRLGARARGLIVWDPLPSGSEYLSQLLRSNLANQVAVHGRVTRTSAAMTAALEAGESVLVDGYGISASFYRELIALDWIGLLDALHCPVLMIEVENAAGKAGKAPGAADAQRAQVQHIQVSEPAFWRESRQFYRSAPNMNALSLRWLEAQ